MSRLQRASTALLAASALIATSCAQLTNLPTLEDKDLEKIVLAQSSRVYAGDGRLITTLHGPENRTIVPLSKVPKNLKDAVIAIEDERFYEHEGVDPRAVLRALFANVSSGDIEEGGSTITQQYVKNALIAPGELAEKTFERKINEAALARQLETKLSKKEILERYLNTVYFGKGAYGIQAAARAYFNKPAKALSLPESALLAGIIKAPESYDPFDRPEKAVRRRNLVISQMERLDFAPQAKAAEAKRQGLGLRPGRDTDRYIAPYFVDYVKRLIKFDPRFKDLGKTPEEREQLMFQGGLRIYTTVDPEAQRSAEEAVRQILYQPGDPHGSLVAIDPHTGAIMAMVGGRDFFAPRKKDPFAKLNLATLSEPKLDCVRYQKGKKSGQCRKPYEPAPAPGTGRQAGSSFKPFALEAAIEQGVSLSKVFDGGGSDGSAIIPGADNGADYTVHNYESGAFGKISLLEAMVNSVNVVFALLGQEIGVQSVIDTAKKMGVTTPLFPYASAPLGTNEVNPLGMASAFGTFATNGDHHPPVAVKRIEGPDGKVLYKDKSQMQQDVVEPGAAFLTTTALEQVVLRGTGTRAGEFLGRPAAGKTGTSQEYRDAWFVGYTPDIVAAVWVGYPKGQIEMKPSCSVTHIGEREVCRPTRTITSGGVTGGSFPAQIWNYFITRALTNVPASDFIEPPDAALITVTTDKRNGCLAGEFTPEEHRVTSTFVAGTEPTEECREEGDIAEVPDVVGFSSVPEAIEVLEEAGFDVSTREEESTTYPPGTVVGQTPSGGSDAARGSTVTITVSVTESDDDDDEGTTTIPSVLGLTRGEAEGRLQSAGFSVVAVTESESSPGQAKKRSGRVWKQSPGSGTGASPGSTVTIYVNP